MYSKFPAEIKPSKTSAKLTYANAFESDCSLLLRERRSITLIDMQEATLEVESNMLATGKLKNHSNFDQDRKCKREMASTSMARSSDKMDDMNKIIKNLSAKVNRLEMENKNPS